MRKKIIIKSAKPSDKDRVITTLVLAFSADPVTRWVWPDPLLYYRYFSEFIDLYAGKAFRKGTAYYLENFLGSTLWLPPGVKPGENKVIALLMRSVSKRKQKDVFSVFEQSDKFHPKDPHWYLPFLGVDPFHQGKGFGTALLKYALARLDREKKIAYLESSNPKNLSFYNRNGFDVLGTIQVGSSPPLVPMIRRPK